MRSPRSAFSVLASSSPMMRSRITHRRHFGICHNNGDVRKTHCERCAALNSRRTVAYHPIEHLPKLANDPANAIFSQGVFVSRLGGGKQRERIDAFVRE